MMLTYAKCDWVLTDMGTVSWGLVEQWLVPLSDMLGYRPMYEQYTSNLAGAQPEPEEWEVTQAKQQQQQQQRGGLPAEGGQGSYVEESGHGLTSLLTNC